MGVGRAFQREGKVCTKALKGEEALVTQKKWEISRTESWRYGVRGSEYREVSMSLKVMLKIFLICRSWTLPLIYSAYRFHHLKKWQLYPVSCLISSVIPLFHSYPTLTTKKLIHPICKIYPLLDFFSSFLLCYLDQATISSLPRLLQ